MNNKKVGDDLKAVIAEAAEEGARKTLMLQRSGQNTNHYRAMEDLLRAYPNRLRLMKHPEEFEFFPAGRSKDISIAPPPGSGVVDKIDVIEMFAESKAACYEREMALLHETEYAIAPFKNLPEFNVIRLVYFNQDAHGNDRGEGAKRYTWEEVAAELEEIGIEKAVTVIRRWRSRLVRDMTVMMFGADGALSINKREVTKKEKEKHEAEVEGS